VRDRPGVIVYVTRAAPADWELLLFDVVGEPDYTAIVPGGGIEPGETAEDAAVRETLEETGLDVRVVAEIGVDAGTRFFHAAPVGETVDEWEHASGMVLCYWKPLGPELRVWGARGDLLPAVKRHRVVAYVTRDRDGRRELLVFEHRDYPAAGTQVPAGRLDPGETLEAGLRRELAEEAGLTNVRVVRELAGFEDHYGNRYENHGFHVALGEEASDEWEHVVLGEGDDAGLVFRYRWVPLEPDPHLFGRPHPLLSELAKPIENV
jgi:8-oxo-dGTP diphosphatase